MVDFDVAFDRLMGHEGNYSNDRTDPGNWTGGRVGVGELKGTKFGIAANTYGHLDIKNLTREDVKAIYREDFWEKIHADKLADGVAWQALDFAVNSGPKTAIQGLQRAVRVAPDGWWGEHSQAALETMTESDVIMLLIAERIDYMTGRKNWPEHGKGWARRMAKNLRYGAEDSD